MEEVRREELQLDARSSRLRRSVTADDAEVRREHIDVSSLILRPVEYRTITPQNKQIMKLHLFLCSLA